MTNGRDAEGGTDEAIRGTNGVDGANGTDEAIRGANGAGEAIRGANGQDGANGAGEAIRGANAEEAIRGANAEEAIRGASGPIHGEEHRRWSDALGQEMPIRVYGHAGRPVLAFPSMAGRFSDFEDFGMVEACRPFLESGRMRLVAADSIDAQSWGNRAIEPAERARRHEQYDRYIVGELLPYIRELTGRETVWTAGVSMGAYHAANLLFRHPDVIDGLVAMSGVYQVGIWVGAYMDDTVYFNSPLVYLRGLDDRWYLDRLRRARIAVGVGQGAWESRMVADTYALEAILASKAIPAIVDYWGYDVDHDWAWWRRMLPHFLERLGV